jgi:hypothetical protein
MPIIGNANPKLTNDLSPAVHRDRLLALELQFATQKSCIKRWRSQMSVFETL